MVVVAGPVSDFGRGNLYCCSEDRGHALNANNVGTVDGDGDDDDNDDVDDDVDDDNDGGGDGDDNDDDDDDDDDDNDDDDDGGGGGGDGDGHGDGDGGDDGAGDGDSDGGGARHKPGYSETKTGGRSLEDWPEAHNTSYLGGERVETPPRRCFRCID